MRKASLVPVVLVAAMGSAGALAQQPTGPYIGVLGGKAEFKVSELNYKTDKFSWGLFGGYQFTPYIGAEVAYLQANKVKENLGGSPPITLGVKTSAYTGSVVGTYPLGDTWSLHGRLGGARTKLKASVTDGTASEFASDSSTELIYGAGIGAMLDGARIRLEYQHINGDGIKVGLVSLGIVWFLPTGR
ncbi:MAG: porin family protein [Steroidobacteraceae bacterium]